MSRVWTLILSRINFSLSSSVIFNHLVFAETWVEWLWKANDLFMYLKIKSSSVRTSFEFTHLRRWQRRMLGTTGRKADDWIHNFTVYRRLKRKSFWVLYRTAALLQICSAASLHSLVPSLLTVQCTEWKPFQEATSNPSCSRTLRHCIVTLMLLSVIGLF